jgi:Mrp family chromosome partitioning ATPase
MSKIYEALENSHREMKGGEKPAVELFIERPSLKDLKTEMEEEMVCLYQTINSLLADVKSKIIQFIGSQEREGTSTIAREFAGTSALKFGKSVLLLDADQRNSSQRLFFGITPECGWGDVIRDGKPVDAAFCRVGKTSLFVSPFSNSPFSTYQFFDPLVLDIFWKEVRQRFDLVIVDSPPATPAFDSTALSNKANGVILVLEAETTRWPVAENIKDRIIKNGGNLLGVVFNKRRYHIPELIYKRL